MRLWAVAASLLALSVAGCGMGASRSPIATFPSQTFGPGTSVTAAVDQTRGEIARALATRGFGLRDPQIPYRPPEAAAFAGAPRDVVQVVLRDDPDHGFVSIYEFGSRGEAAAAAAQQAAFIGSGPGRVHFPPDARFVIRQVGTTVVFYAWSPSNVRDPEAGAVHRALETVGTEVPVPR